MASYAYYFVCIYFTNLFYCLSIIYELNCYFDFFCFVDFSSLDGKYKIYKINISSEELKNLKVNENGETFQEQIDSKRRPRFSVYDKFINCQNKCTGEPLFEGDLNK